MSGLIFFGVIGLWVFLILPWVVKKILLLLPSSWDIRKNIAAVILFLIIFPMPLIDEIIGKIQFEHLCENNFVRIPNVELARGVVAFEEPFLREDIRDNWLPMWKLTGRLIDVKNKNEIASYDVFYSRGGRLFPGFDSGPDPLLFKRDCWPVDEQRFLDLKIKRIEKSRINQYFLKESEK